jgi:tRNA-uridine 2-sulfurtransferase
MLANSATVKTMRCLALFTGGLDSQIAVRLMQRQGIEVLGVSIRTPFTNNLDAAVEAAARLQIELVSIGWGNDYFDLLSRPRFGFAQEMAPCLDCRIGMIERARNRMESENASFLISGDVVGQRPSSLRSRDLETMAIHGGADDLLLRPLSAKLLPPTLPERNGWVDRTQLFSWHGRGRKEELQLAREWELTEPSSYVPGCALLEPTYAARLRRLLLQNPEPTTGELSSLKFGRHFWRDRNRAHLVVAKNADEGTRLEQLGVTTDHRRSVLLKPANFRGPLAWLAGDLDDAVIADSIGVVVQFSKGIVPRESLIQVHGWVPSEILLAKGPEEGQPRRFVGFTE